MAGRRAPGRPVRPGTGCPARWPPPRTARAGRWCGRGWRSHRRPGRTRQLSSRRARATSSPGSGARTSVPVAAGAASMRFTKRSVTCSTSRAARSDDLRRTAVVGGQVDPAQARQARREVEDPRARPPAARRRWSGRRHPPGRCRGVSPASSSASSSCVRSRSCDSSTSSTRAARRQSASDGRDRCAGPAARRPRGRPCRSSRRRPALPDMQRRPHGYAARSGGGPRSGSSVRRVNASSRMRIVGRRQRAARELLDDRARSASRVTSTPRRAGSAGPARGTCAPGRCRVPRPGLQRRVEPLP